MAHAEVADALPADATADRAIAEFAGQPTGRDVPFAITGLDEEPYAADPAFAGGQYFLDDFWANPASPTNYFQGRKVARLSNGDIVVAAMVKNPNGNQTNGLWNIGLVRYNAAGTQRVPWPNGGIYAHVDGEYIVYPKINDAAVGWIQDIRVTGDKILVAFQWHFAGTDDIDTRVLVFGQDGSFKSNTGVFVGSMA